MCSSSTFVFHTNNTSFFFFPISFGGFQQKSYASMWGHYGFRIMGVLLGPLSEALSLTTDIFWWYRSSFYGGLCPIYFSTELGSSGSIFVSRFRIFDKPILEEYVFQVEEGPHLFQSCLCVTRDGLPLATREMHLSFENLIVTNAPVIGISYGHPPRHIL